MKNTLEDYKKQHMDVYQKAICELIFNNTNSLVDGDILTLVKSPPLDSMDTIKSKLISLSKKEGIILENEKLSHILMQFRKQLAENLEQLKDIRNDFLIEKVKSFSPVRETEIIRIMKKDLDSINKELKKVVKDSFNKNINDYLLLEIGSIYGDGVEEEKKERIRKQFSKYIKTTYMKQLKESISIKILVKDRTLLNGILEQGERYLYTKANSYLFHEEKE